MVVGDDVGVRGNISDSERDQRYKGLKLRDFLRLSLADHDMHRSRKEEWFDDDNMHVQRKQLHMQCNDLLINLTHE